MWKEGAPSNLLHEQRGAREKLPSIAEWPKKYRRLSKNTCTQEFVESFRGHSDEQLQNKSQWNDCATSPEEVSEGTIVKIYTINDSL
jgi:hypothetical protein